MKKLAISFLVAILGTIIFSEGKGLLVKTVLRPVGSLSQTLRFIAGDAEISVTVFLGMGIAVLVGIIIVATLTNQRITWRKGFILIGVLVVTMLCAALVAGLRTAVSFVLAVLPLGGLLPGLLYTLFLLLLISIYLTLVAIWTKKIIWGAAGR